MHYFLLAVDVAAVVAISGMKRGSHWTQLEAALRFPEAASLALLSARVVCAMSPLVEECRIPFRSWRSPPHLAAAFDGISIRSSFAPEVVADRQLCAMLPRPLQLVDARRSSLG